MGIFTKLFSMFRKESRTTQVRVAAVGSGGTIEPVRNYENFARETYLKNATAFQAITCVAWNVSIPPWGLFKRLPDGNREQITDDPLVEVLKRPNPSESLAFLMLRASAYLAMSGNSFFERITQDTGPNRGILRELHALRPDRMKILVEPTTGQLRGYKYTVQGRSAPDFEVDPITGQSDVLHLKSFHPIDDWWGAAPTESAAREIDTSNAATQSNKALLDNQGRPSMIYTLIGNLGDDQFENLDRHIREVHSGPANTGKHLIVTGERGTKVEPYGWSPKDLDFNEGDLRLMRKISQSYGVPPMLIGIPGENKFANYKEGRLAFWESTVLFYLNYIRGELNNWLFKRDDPLFYDYILDDVPALAPKRDMLWKRAEESNFLTLDEKRELVGKGKYEPTDDPGSMIFIEASKIPISMATEGEGKEEEEEEKARQDLIEQGYSDDEVDDMLGYTHGDEEQEDEQKEFDLDELEEMGAVPDEGKPFPGEHACRLFDPGQFDRFNRINCFRRSANRCVDYIFGIKGNKSKVQALRYKKKVWTASEARVHCKGKGGTFEAASKEVNMKEGFMAI